MVCWKGNVVSGLLIENILALTFSTERNFFCEVPLRASRGGVFTEKAAEL